MCNFVEMQENSCRYAHNFENSKNIQLGGQILKFHFRGENEQGEFYNDFFGFLKLKLNFFYM